MAPQAVAGLAAVLNQQMEITVLLAVLACTMTLAELGVNMHEAVKAAAQLVVSEVPVQVTAAAQMPLVGLALLLFVIMLML
jgi:hypothetical protein